MPKKGKRQREGAGGGSGGIKKKSGVSGQAADAAAGQELAPSCQVCVFASLSPCDVDCRNQRDERQRTHTLVTHPS